METTRGTHRTETRHRLAYEYGEEKHTGLRRRVAECSLEELREIVERGVEYESTVTAVGCQVAMFPSIKGYVNVLDEHRDIHARDCHMFEDVHLSESVRSVC